MSVSKWKEYPEYKQSGELIGPLPSHWEVVPLKRYFAVQLGKMLQSQPKSDDDELQYYLKSVNIQWEGVSLKGLNKMWFSPKEMTKFRLLDGDLLISEGGDVGRSCIYSGTPEECYIQNAVNRVRAIDKVSTKYLYYWMKAIHSAGIIEIICNKSTIPHFTAEKVAEVRFFLPPVNEIEEIVKFLDKQYILLSKMKNEWNMKIPLFDELYDALVLNAVTGKIDVRKSV